MIFSIEGHIDKILNNEKTMTRRPTDKYKVERLYAIQPGRGKPGIPDGKIYISAKRRESRIGDRRKDFWTGYPLLKWEAQAEGGYTVKEFEELYESMYPNWRERWVYLFSFMSKEEIKMFKMTCYYCIHNRNEKCELDVEGYPLSSEIECRHFEFDTGV